MNSAVSGKNEQFVVKSGKPLVKAGQCTKCNRYYFPFLNTCDRCKNQLIELNFTKGKVHSYTKVHISPSGYEAPYTIGYIDLNEHIRILNQIKFEGELKLDTSVELVFEENAPKNSQFIFKPIKS
ncbi:Zn-ribbon domain-containing OB-fold protein [Bacillus sp. FJAT-29814]|uniref:Zn-ribbon domain-containing OB-fold protein n=1 Tax=Bacillus sp. FJAT-29814 TaxID=1729688 RepID=UPI000829AF3A|nr:OB-fold domain-containing protein [Bacillus sp. FJAT-29814]